MLTKLKKYLLSLFVIISSAIYVTFQQPGNKQNVPSDRPRSATNQLAPAPIATPSQSYNDGQYPGSVADAYYGNIQVKAIIQNGKIADVQFLDYPQDRQTSISINQDAMPVLKQEAIQHQSAQVDIVSGATDTSQAFQESLNSALAQAAKK